MRLQTFRLNLGVYASPSLMENYKSKRWVIKYIVHLAFECVNERTDCDQSNKSFVFVAPLGNSSLTDVPHLIVVLGSLVFHVHCLNGKVISLTCVIQRRDKRSHSSPCHESTDANLRIK